jgi:hypothetical protein
MIIPFYKFILINYECKKFQEYSLPAQEFWALWEKILMLECFWSCENFILPENFRAPDKKVDESFFFFFPNIFGHSGKSLRLPKNLGQFGNCTLPNKFGQIIKNEFFSFGGYKFNLLIPP